jgi:hypothetical protein
MSKIAIDTDIATIDLDAISYKALLETGWSIEEVDDATLEYRVFLHLIRYSLSAGLAPSKRVDIIWHHHILDTEKYMSDCQQLFGRYIHHYPYAGMLSEIDAKEQHACFEKTQKLTKALLSA